MGWADEWKAETSTAVVEISESVQMADNVQINKIDEEDAIDGQ